MLAAKVKKIIQSASQRHRFVPILNGNSGNDKNVEREILALLKGLPDDKPFVIVRDLHVRLGTPQPRILRALDKLHKRGKIARDHQLHDPLASRVYLPYHSPVDAADA